LWNLLKIRFVNLSCKIILLSIARHDFWILDLKIGRRKSDESSPRRAINIVQYLLYDVNLLEGTIFVTWTNDIASIYNFEIKKLSEKHEMHSYFALTDSRINILLNNRFGNTVKLRGSESTLYLISHGRIIAASDTCGLIYIYIYIYHFAAEANDED